LGFIRNYILISLPSDGKVPQYSLSATCQKWSPLKMQFLNIVSDFVYNRWILHCYRGKFGTVYRCQEKSTGLQLAAKFVATPKREDRRNVEREIEIMRLLQHPRLIQLYDAYDNGKVMCVVLELWVQQLLQYNRVTSCLVNVVYIST